MHHLVPRATDPGRRRQRGWSLFIAATARTWWPECIAARQLKRAGAGSVQITAERLLPHSTRH
jgi:hypothetical protein